MSPTPHGFAYRSEHGFGVRSPHGFWGGELWASVWALDVGNKCTWAYDTGANIYAVGVDPSGNIWAGGDTGNGGNTLFKLNPSGSLLFAVGTPAYPVGNLAIDAAGNVYCAGGENGSVGHVWSVDTSGNLRWSVAIFHNSVGAIATDGTTVYVSEPYIQYYYETDSFAALGASTGSTQWQASLTTYEISIAGGALYAGGFGPAPPTLACERSEVDGSLIQSFGQVATGGALANAAGNVFLLSNKVTLVSSTVESLTALTSAGATLWTDNSGAASPVPPLHAMNSMVLGPGATIYVQSTDGFKVVGQANGLVSWTWPYLAGSLSGLQGAYRVAAGPATLAYLGSVRTKRAGIPIG